MSAKEIERKPERISNQHEYMPKKETNDSKNKEQLKKVVCYGCGQTGHMTKDKNCPKNNKDKKKVTTQIYAAREDESEESKPHRGSHTAWKEKKWDSRMNPKRRKKYGCIHTELRNSKKTSKK